MGHSLNVQTLNEDIPRSNFFVYKFFREGGYVVDVSTSGGLCDKVDLTVNFVQLKFFFKTKILQLVLSSDNYF